MSVDCRLETRAPIVDVTKALGILLGCRRTWTVSEFDNSTGWADVEGVKMRGTDYPTMAEIFVTLPEAALPDLDANETGQRFFTWHFQVGPGGECAMLPKSTACNIALMRRLAQTFGGTFAVRDDADDVERYSEPTDLHADDGAAWQTRQDRLMHLTPLTQADIDACRNSAAY